MASKIQIKRGLKANLPALDVGEPALVTNTGAEEVYVGSNSGNLQIALQKDISDLDTQISNLVPITRKVNGKALSSDITITSEDIGSSDNSSYMAFCANVNTASLDAAFGKGNEDRISGIGRQLAMYAWYKGDSKTTYPFTNLLTCSTFQDCLNNTSALDEILDNVNICNLIIASPYSKTIFEAKLINNASTYLIDAYYLKLICKNDTLSDIYASTIQSYRADIISVLDNSLLFSKTTSTSLVCQTGGDRIPNQKYGASLNTNTIIIPKIFRYHEYGNPSDAQRWLYYGSNESVNIWYTNYVPIYNNITVLTGVSLRGIYSLSDWRGGDLVVICDVYTVI